MSKACAYAWKIGITLSLLVGGACICAAVWATRYPDLLLAVGNGMPVGDKELVAYRQGLDFRLVSWERVPVFVLPSSTRVAGEPRNDEWGWPFHWLKVPGFGVSLWWPFTLSLVLPGLWLVRQLRRRANSVGFPVVVGARNGSARP